MKWGRRWANERQHEPGPSEKSMMGQSMIRKPVLMARYLCSRRYCCAYNDVLPLPYRCALAWRSRTRLEISLRLFQHFASCEHGLPRALRGEKAQRRRIGNNGCDDCEKAETVRALHRKVPQVEQGTRREWPRRAITQRNGLAEPFDASRLWWIQRFTYVNATLIG